MASFRRGLTAAIVGAQVVACSLMSLEGFTSDNPDAEPSASDASKDVVPADSGSDQLSPPDGGGCSATEPAYTFGAEELLGTAPTPPDASAGFLFGVTSAGGTVYVSVTNDYNHGVGSIYRVTGDGEWSPVAHGIEAARLATDGTSLFAMEPTRILQMPLDCIAPCSAVEAILTEAMGDFWVENERSIFWVTRSGALKHSTFDSHWATEHLAEADLPANLMSIAATADAIYVAQAASPRLFVHPRPGRPPPAQTTLTLPTDGAAVGLTVVSRCEQIYVVSSTGAAFRVGLTDGAFVPIGAAAKIVYARAADEYAVYVGHPNGLGIHQMTEDATVPLAATRSVWGMAVDRDYLYYGDHGRDSTSGRLFRRKKK